MSNAAQKPNPDSKERTLSRLFMEALVEGRGMNDFLYRFLGAVGESLGVSHLVLYDYDEIADVFELLYFSGYPAGARAELTRRLHTMDVQRALVQKEPYPLNNDLHQLAIPLYFQQTLEALLVLELPEADTELDDSGRMACRLVSRFVGLFMSSSRLPVNQKIQHVATTDLQRAREVQMAYLPSEHPVTDRYEIYGYNQSSELVGGDYFDYFSQREMSVQCIVADACGHGLAAALIMSTFRGLLHSEVSRFDGIDELFTSLNQKLYVEGDLMQYLTAVFFDFDETQGILRYANAGHFDPLLFHADGTSSQLPGGGPPLGMFDRFDYKMEMSPIKSGDLLVVFTDGLVELRNRSEDFFGIEGVVEAVSARRNASLKDLANLVLARAAQFSQSQPPTDDLTLFLMRFR